MKNVNQRFLAFSSIILISLLFAVNRFHIVEYPILEFHPIRNYLEHLFWGFIAPSFSVLFFLGMGVIFRWKFFWKRWYWIGVVAAISLAICYYFDKGDIQWIDVILEVIGAIISYIFLKTTIKKNYGGKYL